MKHTSIIVATLLTVSARVLTQETLLAQYVRPYHDRGIKQVEKVQNAPNLQVSIEVPLKIEPTNFSFASAACINPPGDVPDCACFEASGAWPLIPAINDVIATAEASLGTWASCFQNSAQARWQVQYLYSSPVTAEWAVALYRILDDANLDTMPPARAWCTETINWWHNQARVPYREGYKNSWFKSKYITGAATLRSWYRAEEFVHEFGEEAGLDGRGRWIDGTEVHYLEDSSFTPGVDGPCPNAFLLWQGYNPLTDKWISGVGHSQMVDSIKIHYTPWGSLHQVDVHVIEGNTTTNCCGIGVRQTLSDGKKRSWITNTRGWYTDIQRYTRYGDLFLDKDKVDPQDTVWKINGWGVDLESDGSTYCDPTRILFVNDPPSATPRSFPLRVISHTMGQQEDEDSALVTQVYAYLTQTGGGNVMVTTNSSAVQTGGSLPDSANHWIIPPAQAHQVDTIYINIDFLTQYPLRIDGIHFTWKDGKVPQSFEVWWADTSFTTYKRSMTFPTTIPPLIGEDPQFSISLIPTTLTPPPSDTGYTVRYMRLCIPRALLSQQYEIVGLDLNIYQVEDDDLGTIDDPLETQLNLDAGWNMVSVPRTVTDYRTIEVFPGSVSSAFSYEGAYTPQETLRNSKGYWLKYASLKTVSIIGDDITSDTVEVNARWNMIGSLSSPFPVTAVMVVPPISIVSDFFGYSMTSGYSSASIIEPGKAYWVKVSSDGQLVLNSSSSTNSVKQLANTPENVLDTFSKLRFKDSHGKERVLYFSAHGEDIDVARFELPPSPPPGILDVRFETQRVLEVAEKGKQKDVAILISSAIYPLTLQWTVSGETDAASLIVDGKEISINGDNETHISNPKSRIHLRLLLAKSLELPKSFALHQNYPNPFNPVTVIRYQLPVNSWVTLKVYNVLGQEIKTLVDEIQYAGFRSVEWNASSVPSGVYFYRLTAGDASTGSAQSFTQVKNMLLLR
ncbi:MAG: T9SS type A sorting domain-containing protein [Ignavibacteriae bacterium]|nr:T9SS type A sorting domain-containing protein [Ignavibacteriota bacterium]